MADLAERLAGLTPEGRAALARKLAARARKPLEANTIPRLPAGAVAPLSSAQRRLWLLDRLVPERAAYNVPVAVRLAGPLDAATLGRAWAVIVGRHAILRTAFALDGDEPTQAVVPDAEAPLSVVAVAGATVAEREREAERLARAEGAVPFDLAVAPLVRATLYRIDAADHLLVVVLHHIVADGWAVDLLLRELAAVYDAFARGDPDPLPPLALEYADFAAWHHAREAGGGWRRRSRSGASICAARRPSWRCRPIDRARRASNTAARSCATPSRPT